MPLLYWALEDIQQTLLATGYKIVTKTDVAVHLWLRWTYKPPQKHAKPVLRRGLLMMYDARFCFVDFCDVEQEEEGDTFTHTFYVPSTEPPGEPPPSEWPFYEPWGTYLTENYPWEEHGFLGGSNTSLAAGKMTLYNDTQGGINIATPTPSPKPVLGSGTGIDLYLSYSSPAVDYDPTYGFLTYILVTKNDNLPGDVFDIEPIVARGSHWGPWGENEMVFGITYAFDMGQGPGVINFTDRWKRGRQLAGKSTDPTGWYIDEIFITNEQLYSAVIQSHTSDYLGCYLKQATTCNQIPWLTCETRYFYFWATSQGEKMKSTSPIFSKHFAPPKIFTALALTSDFDGFSGWKKTYPVFHDAPGSRCRNTNNSVAGIQARGSGTYWHGYRSAMVFDTIGLPPGWTITKIEIHFRIERKYLEGSGNLCFIDGTGASLACDPTAFSMLKPFTSIIAEAPWADLANDTWAMVEVAPSGFNVLNPGGDTIIVIREKNERNADPNGVPGDAAHGYSIYSADEPGKEPYLVIYGE